MTWKNVFNSTHRWWGDIEKAQQVAKEAGYKFFCWSNRIYDTESGKDTGILEEHVL